MSNDAYGKYISTLKKLRSLPKSLQESKLFLEQGASMSEQPTPDRVIDLFCINLEQSQQAYVRLGMEREASVVEEIRHCLYMAIKGYTMEYKQA